MNNVVPLFLTKYGKVKEGYLPYHTRLHVIVLCAIILLWVIFVTNRGII